MKGSPKSRQELDARSRGYNNGAFIGMLVAGPVFGSYVGGKMGEAHCAKNERLDFERGGHERTADTTGAWAKRAAKGMGGALLRSGVAGG